MHTIFVNYEDAMIYSAISKGLICVCSWGSRMRGKVSDERILKKKIVAENGPNLVGDILTELRNSANFRVIKKITLYRIIKFN